MNAYEQPGLAITLVPTTDFSKAKHTFVSVGADGQMIAAAAGTKAVGVTQTPGIAKEPCNVMITGISFIQAGGKIAPGQEVEVGAGGKAVVKATGIACGVCLVGAESGAIGTILVK